MAYGRNFYNDQQVFLGEQGSSASELKGVQSFDGSWSLPYEQMIAAGYNFAGNEINGALVGEVGVSRSIVEGADFITGLLDASLSGYLIYGKNESYDKTFNFSQGYINSYESSCSIGDVASADFNLTVYGNIGKLNSESRTYTPITPQVANASNIVLTTPFGSTNAIQSYSLNLDFSREPIHKIGDMMIPSEFVTDVPVVAKITFEALVNDFESEELRDAICSGFSGDLGIQLNTCNGTPIRNFTLNNAQKIDESLSAGIGDDMSLNVSYEAYYDSVTGAATIFS